MRASIELFVSGLAAAARFLPRAWRSSWAALALTALVVGLALDAGGAWWLAVAVLALVTRGGLWRLALTGDKPGPGGLQAGRIELRLAVAWLLSGLFLAILAMLLLVVFLACAYAVASAGPGFNAAEVATWRPAIVGRGEALLGAVGVVGLAALAFAAARISLAEPATVARGRLQVLSTWPLTRGRALVLLTGHAVLAALVIALAALRWPGPWWIACESLAVAGLWLPTSVGFMAYAYESRIEGR
ncbi:MAG: hypothetical protein ACREEB_08310 [Caulobacteraceae bacterium]